LISPPKREYIWRTCCREIRELLSWALTTTLTPFCKTEALKEIDAEMVNRLGFQEKSAFKRFISLPVKFGGI